MSQCARHLSKSIIVVLTAGLFACRSATTIVQVRPAGEDAGTPGDGDGDGDASVGSAGNDAGADSEASSYPSGLVCGSVVDRSPGVSWIGEIGAPPDARGGTIIDGTYVLTEYHTYGGAPGPQSAILTYITLAFFQGTADRVGVDIVTGKNEPLGETLRTVSTMGVEGTDVTYTTKCSSDTSMHAGDTQTYAYTATPTSYVEIAADATTAWMLVFERQP